MGNAFDSAIIYTGKNSIVWNGDNLKEVIELIGKFAKFDQWFKNFQQYEDYVHGHNNILKMFIADNEYYEVYVGCNIEKQYNGSWLPVTKGKYKYVLKA